MDATAAMLVFEGFDAGAFAFFRTLAKNNNREWFQPRKEAFERDCLAPFKALTVALNPPEGARHITRIYRDVRFSKDKSPYQLHISGIVGDTYLQLSGEGLYVGTGLYMPDAGVLRALREAIAEESSGSELVKLVKALRAKGYTVQSHESVASVPRGYSAEHPRIELLRMKDLHAGRVLEPALLAGAKALKEVRRAAADVAPVKAWLDRYVGTAAGG